MATSPARDLALHRVAFVFGRRTDQVRMTDRFDAELTARPPNDFRANEFDQLLEDVQQMKSGGLKSDGSIVTVGDFCALAELYSVNQPRRWTILVNEWNKEERMTTAPTWRRAIWKWVGL